MFCSLFVCIIVQKYKEFFYFLKDKGENIVFMVLISFFMG